VDPLLAGRGNGGPGRSGWRVHPAAACAALNPRWLLNTAGAASGPSMHLARERAALAHVDWFHDGHLCTEPYRQVWRCGWRWRLLKTGLSCYPAGGNDRPCPASTHAQKHRRGGPYLLAGAAALDCRRGGWAAAGFPSRSHLVSLFFARTCLSLSSLRIYLRQASDVTPSSNTMPSFAAHQLVAHFPTA